jgi:DNA-binding XRE family transcriptional regulator
MRNFVELCGLTAAVRRTASYSLSMYRRQSPKNANVPGDPKRTFGRNMRELRLAKGVSQEKLTEIADLHRTYVGGIERGERNVSLENIVRLGNGGVRRRPCRRLQNAVGKSSVRVRAMSLRRGDILN